MKLAYSNDWCKEWSKECDKYKKSTLKKKSRSSSYKFQLDITNYKNLITVEIYIIYERHLVSQK